MAHLWVPKPRSFPYRCFATGASGMEQGPYLEMDSGMHNVYIDPHTRREGRQYWSFVSWRTTVVAADSPYRDILDEAVEARTEELQAEIDELKRQLAQDPVRQMARQVTSRLEEVLPRVEVEDPEDQEAPDPVRRQSNRTRQSKGGRRA